MAAGVSCPDLLQKEQIALDDASSLTRAQVERLHEVFQKVPEVDRQKVFQSLADPKVFEKLTDIRSGRTDATAETLLTEYPLLQTVLADIVELGIAFPTIYSTKRAESVVPQLLKSLLKQSATRKSSGESLDSEGYLMASAFSRSLNHTLKNLIQSAIQEHQGITYNRGAGQRFIEGISRYFSPLYRRVKDSIASTQEFQKQLGRMSEVDSIVMAEGLSQVGELSLDEKTIDDLSALVTDTPGDIETMLKTLRKIFGEELSVTRAAVVQKLNAHTVAEKLDKLDLNKTIHNFDDSNVWALDRFNQLISEGRVRQGLQPRTEKDFAVTELQILHEALTRRAPRLYSKYKSATEERSRESYTIEDRRTRQVPDGKDSKGNAKYRTETYYVDETVTPSFEDILSGSYDRGDRFVSGLDEIIARAAKMVKKETPFRKLISDANELIENVIDNYGAIVQSAEKQAASLEKLQKMIDQISLFQRDIEAYMKWTDSQISNQYSKDSVKNFRSRNEAMAERYENMGRLLKLTHELLKRQTPQLTMVFNVWDYTEWLSFLDHYRSRTRFQQGVIATTSAGLTGLYFFNQTFADTINSWVGDFLAIFSNFN